MRKVSDQIQRGWEALHRAAHPLRENPAFAAFAALAAAAMAVAFHGLH
ncbi:hypothetical protein [Paraburkholderia mimosarum]|nr:hypothetical protein [Paraburkholderia mimosarum]